MNKIKRDKLDREDSRRFRTVANESSRTLDMEEKLETNRRLRLAG